MAPSAEAASSQATSDKRGVPGYRVVLGLFAAAAAIAGVIVLVAVIVGVPEEGNDVVCTPEPAACASMRDYVAALNATDADRLLELVTPHAVAGLLQSESEGALRARVAQLTVDERVEDLVIQSVAADEEEALVHVRYKRGGDEYEQSYRLVFQDGRWLIDG